MGRFVARLSALAAAAAGARAMAVPPLATAVDQKALNVLPRVLPATRANASTYFQPPGTTAESWLDKPFHVYDEAFLDIIGPDPAMVLVAEQPQGYKIYHEGFVWHPATDDVFFIQNENTLHDVPGYNASSGIFKVSLPEVEAAARGGSGGSGGGARVRNVSGLVAVDRVEPAEWMVNLNGGTAYGESQVLYVSEGSGPDKPPSIYVMDLQEPYNATLLLNNFHGRQFNGLNDAAVHPAGAGAGAVYFTDTLVASLLRVRPPPGLPPQVYRWDPATGAVAVVADGFAHPNGIAFSPDGATAYVTDTGVHWGKEWKLTNPSTIYRFDVQADGTFANRQTFAFADSGFPDGIRCDARGNVWSACGDGVSVWSPAGTLLGKVFTGSTVANFNFVGRRASTGGGGGGASAMMLGCEDKLYYITVAAEPAAPVSVAPISAPS